MTTEINTPLFHLTNLPAGRVDGLPEYIPSRGEHLEVVGDTVYWMRNGLLFRKLSYSSEEVICAHFTEFNYLENTTDKRAVVVILWDMAYIYFANGQSYTMSMPFVVKRAFSCQKGLILERDLSSEEVRPGYEEGSIPKFFTLFDPILDLGLVVSSSTSAISPAEELAFLGSSSHSSICLTFNSREKILNIYHTRFLSHSKSKTDGLNRRHSSRRRSSSMIQRPSHESESNDVSDMSALEQRLSFSRSDITSAMDRMGTADVGVDGVHELASTGFDISTMRKEVILTLLESVPYSTELDGLKVFSLVYQDQEALAILNKTDRSASVIFFNRSSGPVGVPSSEETYSFPAQDITTIKGALEDEPCMLIVLTPEGDGSIFHPFLNIQSPKIAFPSSWGGVRALVSSHQDTFMVETETNEYKSMSVPLEPSDELTQFCFSSLETLLDALSMEYLRFIWLGAMSLDESLDEWTAFGATVLNCLIDFEGSTFLVDCNGGTDYTEDPDLSSRIAEICRMNSIAYQVRQSAIGTQLDFKDVKSFVVMCLHIAREELKLNITARSQVDKLGSLLAWIVNLAGWSQSWASYYYEEEVMRYIVVKGKLFYNVFGLCANKLGVGLLDCQQPMEEPPNIFATLFSQLKPPIIPFIPLSEITNGNSEAETGLIPRIIATIEIFKRLGNPEHEHSEILDLLMQLDVSQNTLRQLPEGIQVPIQEVLSRLKPLGNEEWCNEAFELLERYDLKYFHTEKLRPQMAVTSIKENPKDIRTITQSVQEQDTLSAWDGQSEADRLAISRLIFSEDRRFYEVSKLLQSSRVQIATLIPSPDWSEHEHLQQQQELFKSTALRAFSVSLGRAALFYSARRPLVTERYAIPRINFTLVIKPSNSTVSLQKMFLSDENVAWGYFHNGISAGLSVSRQATHISGSWIVFNKPSTLTSQHAGFLLGLGLNGHLKKLEEWHIYNYLGPKHTHTSVALLIGMSASHLGSMNTKLTKVLSVHVAALLPVGSNDLYVSMLVQTAGLIGIGLLYFNTQHRRMTEILLAEISTNARNWNDDSKKDEGYRLAAGMSLGLVNLGKGTDLKGLNDMHIVERLLELAVVSKDVQSPEVLDSAVPGAIIALAFVFMKTHNETVVRKIDVPDTEQRFDYIRPDFLLLRTLTKHLIQWDYVGKNIDWVEANIPAVLLKKYKVENIKTLDSDQMSYFNILGGLCFAMGLRYVSTGDEEVKQTLLHYLDWVMKMCELPIINTDQKLVKRSIMNVQCLISLSVSIVMVSSGDLDVFRRLRMLYARTKKEQPFGNFMANQTAMGLLFMGGGQYALSNSSFSIACLIMAFYPLFPSTLQDNRAHLQALRHFWVLAAEPRCLVTREITSQTPCNVDIEISLKNSTEIIRKTAPCVIPQLDIISTITTISNEYYPIHLDFEANSTLVDKFKRDQNIYVSKMSTTETGNAMLEILRKSTDDNQEDRNDESKNWLSNVLSQLGLNKLEKGLVLPTKDIPAESYLDATVVDMKLTLESMAKHPKNKEDLWNLRILFAFAEKYRPEEDLRFVSRPTIDKLKVDLWRFKSQLT
ncbi:hypothetical protein TRICI_004739 [Trichomonascus ciferrii]|uniref:Uncharacterized protein n=1 Tax=Trichomonascus ciferrii TaxID=44093 RepID=A0A642UZH7_9ASCO|nr:hypothetical protein TRICI_004739 [Trichomonascus ciferrii]